MGKVNIFFLHGFLGRPRDWSVVKEYLSGQEGLRIFVPDYFNDAELSPRNSFDSWARNFTKWVEAQGCAKERNILVGYSLGGRLSMHALEKNPALWSKVVLLSANPGFDDGLEAFDPNSESRRDRWMRDSYWAEEFFKGPWETLIRNWNAQAVFGAGESEPLRYEKDYSRELLSLALTQWSLAQQKNMRSVIRQHIDKVIWMVGKRDEKYVKISHQLAEQIPGLRVEEVPASSHRVLFENPQFLGSRLRKIILELA